MPRTLTIDKQGSRFIVDDPATPGSPPVGYGRTMTEAMGNWLRNNQKELGIAFDVLPAAMPAERRRRDRELAKR